jgi:uncharacterized membrane protein HdeD (DUF308 family)
MSDLEQRIEAMYRSDRRWALVLVGALWVAVLAVLFLSWPHIPDATVRLVCAVGAAAILVFNTASMLAMLNHYAEDKKFIYELDILGLDEMKKKR